MPRRCLIVERHAWETGGKQQQLQFVLENARDFFHGRRKVGLHIKVYMPRNARQAIFEKDISISKEYANGTRRTNGFIEMGALPAGFMFFEETGHQGIYEFWWELDTVAVLNRYRGWIQGRDNQHGRGRYSTIVAGPIRQRR